MADAYSHGTGTLSAFGRNGGGGWSMGNRPRRRSGARFDQNGAVINYDADGRMINPADPGATGPSVGATRPHQDSDNIRMSQARDSSEFDNAFGSRLSPTAPAPAAPGRGNDNYDRGLGPNGEIPAIPGTQQAPPLPRGDQYDPKPNAFAPQARRPVGTDAERAIAASRPIEATTSKRRDFTPPTQAQLNGGTAADAGRAIRSIGKPLDPAKGGTDELGRAIAPLATRAPGDTGVGRVLSKEQGDAILGKTEQDLASDAAAAAAGKTAGTGAVTQTPYGPISSNAFTPNAAPRAIAQQAPVKPAAAAPVVAQPSAAAPVAQVKPAPVVPTAQPVVAKPQAPAPANPFSGGSVFGAIGQAAASAAPAVARVLMPSLYPQAPAAPIAAAPAPQPAPIDIRAGRAGAPQAPIPVEPPTLPVPEAQPVATIGRFGPSRTAPASPAPASLPIPAPAAVSPQPGFMDAAKSAVRSQLLAEPDPVKMDAAYPAPTPQAAPAPSVMDTMRKLMPQPFLGNAAPQPRPAAQPIAPKKKDDELA